MTWATPSPEVQAKSLELARSAYTGFQCKCGFSTAHTMPWSRHRHSCSAQWGRPPGQRGLVLQLGTFSHLAPSQAAQLARIIQEAL